MMKQTAEIENIYNVNKNALQMKKTYVIIYLKGDDIYVTGNG